MEQQGKKKGTGQPSIVEDLFGRKDKSAEILNSVLSGSSKDGRKASLQSDSYAPPGKQETVDGNPQGSPSKHRYVHNKEKNPEYQDGKTTPCHLSSSLYYGGPDICSNYPSGQNSGTTYGGYKQHKDGEDDPNNSDMACRGDWWQGSLYY